MQHIIDANSCGTANDHTPEWFVSLTAPDGITGLELAKCTECLNDLAATPAVQTMGRTMNVRVWHP